MVHLVTITRGANGGATYTRYEGRKATHSGFLQDTLSAAEVETFRTNPAAFA